MSDPSNPSPALSVLEGYALWAEQYEEDGNPLMALEGPAMAECWGDVRGLQALDVGCGTGRHTRALSIAGARVIGIDVTPEMLARARARNPQVPFFRQGLPGPLPFPDASFDLITAGLVMEHVEAIDETFAEFARLLAPGGRAIVSDLHADRTAEGQCARFIDPETGERRNVFTLHRTPDDYHGAARRAGLAPTADRHLAVDEALARSLPRAERYLGLNLGWIGAWTK